MKKSILVIVMMLIALLIWFGATIVRLENQNYAMQLGMCGEFDRSSFENVIETYRCLDSVETRTSWLWHLYYALAE